MTRHATQTKIYYSATAIESGEFGLKPYKGLSFDESTPVSIDFYRPRTENTRFCITLHPSSSTTIATYSFPCKELLLKMADSLKAEGNKAFAAKNFDEAV